MSDITYCKDIAWVKEGEDNGEYDDTEADSEEEAFQIASDAAIRGGRVMKYVCKEGFAVEKYDDDGWPTDEYMNIEAGEVYEVNDDWHRVAGGYDSIRLENNENGNWLELQQATIDQYFDKAEEGE